MSFELEIHIFIRNIFSIFYEFLSYFIVCFIVKILRMKTLLVYDFKFWMILSDNYLFDSLCFRDISYPFSKYLLIHYYILYFYQKRTVFLSVLSSLHDEIVILTFFSFIYCSVNIVMFYGKT